ncbi:cell division protein FtsL [Alcaligenaceae bacterium]|nr:cell division protein FtsL [Alcaligenaceae bacterium]
MGRMSILFAVLLMVSAISLVTARFQSRQLFVETDRLEDKARELDTDWRRLQLERAELARNARIDGTARAELKMENTAPDRTIYLKGQAAKPTTAVAPEGRQ